MSRLCTDVSRSVDGSLSKRYREESILHVHMVNYLTYDNCEVFPGPSLNIVLGPNGIGNVITAYYSIVDIEYRFISLRSFILEYFAL